MKLLRKLWSFLLWKESYAPNPAMREGTAIFCLSYICRVNPGTLDVGRMLRAFWDSGAPLLRDNAEIMAACSYLKNKQVRTIPFRAEDLALDLHAFFALPRLPAGSGHDEYLWQYAEWRADNYPKMRPPMHRLSDTESGGYSARPSSGCFPRFDGDVNI